MSNEGFFKKQSRKYRSKKFKIIQEMHSCPDCECYGCYKHGECGSGCNNTKKQNYKSKPKRDFGFENWYKTAMNLYHLVCTKDAQFVKEYNVLHSIRRGFTKNITNYPKWLDKTSYVNDMVRAMEQILREDHK